ncbi:MAG: GNAT family N-acetyltransferase [Gammaproteobacteria bacterium]|nr:GNAT family N-acetyltransferase [Gammaproteobacteria bacterium]
MSNASPFEFRAIQQEERQAFSNVVKYVFADSSIEVNEDEDNLKNEWTTAAFHNGKIVATSGGYPFTMRFNGKDMQADGLTAVGTAPGFRRRGLVREMVTQRLHQVHEDAKQSVSILWASMGAIYQRFGYGLASTHVSSEFDPRYASFQFASTQEGYVRILEKDEGLPIIQKLYDVFIQDRTLDLYRDNDMWKHHFGNKKRRSYVAVYFAANDEPQGYVAYNTREDRKLAEDGGPDQRLQVREFIYLNITAYRGLWEFLREHDLVRFVDMQMPLDDPSFNLLLEPRILGSDVWDGIWLRVVDASQALTERIYNHAGTIVLEVHDDAECPWNERRFLLETDGTRTEVAETNQSADATISPNGLASLLSGNATLSQLHRAGRADVADIAKLAQFDSLFATTYRPFCRDGF